MTGKIFINYRRGDDPGTAGRLYDRLEAEFSPGQLFMDVEGHIRGGDDFVEVLKAQVAQCDVLLAIMGPRWLEIADEQGRRRLDNPEDWVRVEIAGALAGAKRVIPVLVGDADIPRAEDLPDDLKPLARRQVIRITLERFKADAQGLVSQIKGALAEVEARRHADTEADRAALAEAERQRQTAEDARVAERVRQEAERMRAAQLAGMDAAQIRKAEELANWEFIKSKTEAAEFRDHIARFAGGSTERFAEERLAGLTWATLKKSDKAALRAFIDEFPKAPDVTAALDALAAVEAKEQAAREAAEARARETEDWGAVAASTDKAAIEAFLKSWPSGQHASAAKARLHELRNADRFSRRSIMKGVGYGVGGTVAVGGAGIATFVPGMPMWQLIHDRSVRTFTGHSHTVHAVAIAPDGKTAVSSCSGMSGTKVWDVLSGRELQTIPKISVFDLKISMDGKTAIFGQWAGGISVWDLGAGRELRELDGHSESVRAIAITPDGKTFVTGSMDKTLKVWDLASGRDLRTLIGHKSYVNDIAITPDGKTAVSASGDYTLKVWGLASGREARSLSGHLSDVWAVAITPDGKTVVSGSKDKTLKVWDLASGRELLALTGHARQVRAVAITPDGRTAVSGSEDTTLKVWDLASGRDLQTLTGHASGVTVVAITPDGKTVVSGSEDTTLKVWALTR